MKTLYEILEMNEIQAQVKSLCASTLGQVQVDAMSIIDDEDDLLESLAYVKEAMDIVRIHGRAPLGGLYDLGMSLKKANRDGILSCDELLKVMSHLECVYHMRHFIYDVEVDVPLLKESSEGLVEHQQLHHEIQRCILPDGTVSDSASATLSGIRKKMQNMQIQIRQKMESYVKSSKDSLSIDQMTTKNDRLVLPVKSAFKSEFRGLVHAQSATGQTTYIEPEAVVLMNNQLSLLKEQEQDEIERILLSLSTMVKNNYFHFYFNLEILQKLDFIFAKAYFGVQYDCCIPMLTHQGGEFYLKQARHPLIDQDTVVANDIAFSNHKMILISGSNTGGKTVTLKTTGLLSLMALCGLPIPALEARVCMFDQIYVDLGDEQSIEQSLSTFSSHMKKIISILENASSSSLVLMDEIGSGTDPQEGESLAQAILMRFLEMGTCVMASTHYGQLKTFARERDDILLASVGFDLNEMRPTYKLKLDSVGQSYAIEIVDLLGMPDTIVESARMIKNNQMSEHEKLMESLQQQQDILNAKEEELNRLIVENEKIKKDYTTLQKQLKNQKDMILKKARDESNKLIEEAKENIDIVVETMKKSTLKHHEVLQAKHDLDQLIVKEKEVVHLQDHPLQVGDHIKLIKMNREGDIVEILKNHMIMISVSGLNMKVHENDVIFMHSKTPSKAMKKAAIKKVTSKKTGSYEINVIGERYEDAMNIVDKFLDDAIVLGYPHVRIVHGMGTGALRKGIRRMLDKNKHVVSYRDGGPNEGGLGATLVYFE